MFKHVHYETENVGASEWTEMPSCSSIFIISLHTNDIRFPVLVRYLNLVHVIIPTNHLRLFCAVHSPLVLSGVTCSAYFVVLMTFERFYSIIQPHKAASFNTVRKARITIACISLFVLSFHSPYFFIVLNTGRYCIMDNDVARTVSGKVLTWMHFTVFFVIPFVSLIIMNTVIIYTLQKRSQWVTFNSQGQSQGQSSKHSERQMYVILVLVTFGFLVLTTPYYILPLLIHFGPGSSPDYFAKFHLWFNVIEKTYFTNNGIYFFLYVMSGNKFRSDLLRLLKCFKCKEIQNHPISDSHKWKPISTITGKDFINLKQK